MPDGAPQVLYTVDPRTILFPVAERAVLQRLGQPDLAMVDDPTVALAFLTCFSPPATIDAARDRFLSAPGSTAKLTAAAFDKLLTESMKLGILQTCPHSGPTGESDGITAAASASTPAPNDSDLRTFLTTIVLVAEDLATDIAAMGAAAPRYAGEGTGEPLPHVLRRVLGDLTRVAVALGARRSAYLGEQLARLRDAGKKPWLHLGAGGNNLEGWYNIDLAPAELAMNLRWTLPFGANSVEFVMLAHLFEHLYKRRDAPRLLQEVRRVLKPGGVVRIIVPDAHEYMRAYVENDDKFFAMQRQVWFTWAPKARSRLEAILGYLGAPEFPGGLAQHKYGYDFETLKILLEDAGFTAIERSTYMGSAHEALRVDDTSYVAGAEVDGRYASLFVEAQK